MPHVRGLHHVTVLSSGAAATDRLFTHGLGFRRVKRTVNPDAPDSYHLFYGDANGTPGTLVTVHPFANLASGQIGTGEFAEIAFSVTPGALPEWVAQLQRWGFEVVARLRSFERNRILFEGPEGERIVFQIEPRDARDPFPAPLAGRSGIRGIHSVAMRVRDGGEAGRLLAALGLDSIGTDEGAERYAVRGASNGAGLVDVVSTADGPPATAGAGSIHHVAFAVAGRDELDAVRAGVSEAGFAVSDVADRTYFESFFGRGPEGILFEVATDGVGFTVDEEGRSLGEALILPPALAAERAAIEARLDPLDDS